MNSTGVCTHDGLSLVVGEPPEGALSLRQGHGSPLLLQEHVPAPVLHGQVAQILRQQTLKHFCMV